MKQSKLLIHTLREVPRDADVISQQLMMRAGMIQKLAAGIYSYLPLAFRSVRKFEQILREELAKDGCQELLMPTVQPGELWQESGRWSYYGKELLRLKDRKDAPFCLGPTHEEVITDIVRRNVSSYKQLPMNLYQIQTKFRDEIRPRFGLMRGREFIMKDAYSFDVDDEAADKSYWAMFHCYSRIFSRLGVKFRHVEADSGAIGGSYTHEFHVLAGSGEDALLACDTCDYASNLEKTEAPRLPAVYHGPAFALRPAHFKTPGIFSMEEQAAAFRDADHDGMPLHQTSKVYWLDAEVVVGRDGLEHLTRQLKVAVILRGDHEMNTVKVKNLLGAADLQPMADAEDFTGAQSGFLGPVAREGTRHWQMQQAGSEDLVYLVDRSLEGAVNLTCGANVTDGHHFGFDPQRDLPHVKYADLRVAQEGEPCPRCGKGRYQSFRGIEVGQVFKLGTKYSRSMNCVYLDEHGKERPMVMGCYGIGVGRTVAAAIEQNYDEDGIIWPWPIAPYQVHLLGLDPGNAQVREVAERVERELEGAGFEVLYDDREGMSPGAKFKDADLLGFPLRVMVGTRGLKDGVVELRDRRTKDVRKFKPEEIVARVSAARDRIMAELESRHGR
jgi:prolyl-tRNA synthetase